MPLDPEENEEYMEQLAGLMPITDKAMDIIKGALKQARLSLEVMDSEGFKEDIHALDVLLMGMDKMPLAFVMNEDMLKEAMDMDWGDMGEDDGGE